MMYRRQMLVHVDTQRAIIDLALMRAAWLAHRLSDVPGAGFETSALRADHSKRKSIVDVQSQNRKHMHCVASKKIVKSVKVLADTSIQGCPPSISDRQFPNPSSQDVSDVEVDICDDNLNSTTSQRLGVRLNKKREKKKDIPEVVGTSKASY